MGLDLLNICELTFLRCQTVFWTYLKGLLMGYVFCETVDSIYVFSYMVYSWPGCCTKDFYEIHFTASFNYQLDRRRKTLAKHCRRCRRSSEYWGYLLSETGRYRSTPLIQIVVSSFMPLLNPTFRLMPQDRQHVANEALKNGRGLYARPRLLGANWHNNKLPKILLAGRTLVFNELRGTAFT